MKVIYDELYPDEFFNYGGIVKVGCFGFEIKTIKEWKKITSAPKWAFDFINNENGVEDGDAYIGTMHFKFDNENGWFKYIGDLPKLKTNDPYGIPNVNFTVAKSECWEWDKYKEQRLNRGFDDSELWSLDLTIAKFILPRMEAFKENFIGYPAFLKDENEWKEILEKICKAFRLYVNCDNDCIEEVRTIKMLHEKDNPDDLKKILKDHEDYEEGMKLFFKYWRWLGD